MVVKGEVELDMAVQTLLTANMTVPSPGGKPITLVNLASHTSGLLLVAAKFWQKGDDIYHVNESGKRWDEYSEIQFHEYFKSPSPPLDHCNCLCTVARNKTRLAVNRMQAAITEKDNSRVSMN